MPVSSSNTNRTPSGGLLTKSRTSRATRANVRGGKFSELPVLLLEAPVVDPDADPERDRDDERSDEGFDSIDDDDPRLEEPRLMPREREEEAALPLDEKREGAAPVVDKEVATLPVAAADDDDDD
mmetsp:Transcript_5790/g.10451  ORF Transcript_5790/g.10451 Transcript_5790/m.10451 type:complete len:125 (-) Transcript_5790:191-565(-)